MSKTHEAQQRLGPLAALPGLLSRLGADASDVFYDSELNPGSVTPETRVPFSVAASILHRAAEMAARPEIGLLLGSEHDHRSFGLAGQLMEKGKDLRQALSDFVGIQIAHSRGATAYLCDFGDNVSLGYGIYTHQPRGSRQAYDLALAIGVNFIRSLTNGLASPLEVHFSFPRPKEIEQYHRFFRCPLLFDQDHSCIVLSPEALSTPLQTSDPAGRIKVLRTVHSVARDNLNDLPALLRHLIRPHFMSGRCDIYVVSQELGIHPRTMSRRLAKMSTSFGQIHDEVRFTVAQELLSLTSLSIGSIADALLYSSHSAFIHAFRRWTGVTPTEWQQIQRTQNEDDQRIALRRFQGGKSGNSG